jgi:hypothetical protein
MSTGDGEVHGVVKGLLASRESFGLQDGSDTAIQTQQTCIHQRKAISLQTYSERLSEIFPHNTVLKLIEFRETYHTAVRINAIHLTLNRYGPKFDP